MKVWLSFGSEHSSNLVMIGRFAKASDAREAEQVIEQFAHAVRQDSDAGSLDLSEINTRYSPNVKTLVEVKTEYLINPAEVAQFGYEYGLRVQDASLVITTDEYDLSAFMKILLKFGARVDVYSAHTHKGTGHGR